jgi:hypothetical protein
VKQEQSSASGIFHWLEYSSNVRHHPACFTQGHLTTPHTPS